MAYVGNNLSVQQYAPQVAYFSGNGSTTAFTLPVAVVSAAQIIVAIDNVIQNPSSAFTVSGTTITFTSAPLTGTNNIWVEYTSLQTNLVQPAAGSVSQTSFASITGTGATVLQTSPTITTPTLTSPTITGAVVTQANLATGVAGTGPAFSAYRGTSVQSITGATWVQVQFQTEEFDTASCYNNTGSTVSGIPAYSFLPNVAGYYQINLSVEVTSAINYEYVSIYKDGADFKRSSTALGAGTSATVSALVFLNGTTNWVSGYVNFASTANANFGQATTFFQASLVRAA